jgi:uncharacterized protein YpmS
MLLSLTACSANARIDVEADKVNVTVSITEQDVKAAIETALLKSNPPLILNPKVDLRNGEIFVSGDYQAKNLNTTVPGDMTVKIWAENGKLKVQVTSVNAQGVTIPQEKIDNFNQALAEKLENAAKRNNSQATLTNVTITGDKLEFTVSAPRKK